MEKANPKTPKLVADVFVKAAGRVLLVRYSDPKKYDGEGGWFLPDDYLAYGEHPSDTATRILHEQVGLKTQRLALRYIESFGSEDGGRWHLVFHHAAELDAVPSMMGLVGLKSAEWFSLDALPDRASVAHEGWALDVIAEMLKDW